MANLSKEEYKAFKDLERKMAGGSVYSKSSYSNDTKPKAKHSGAKLTRYVNKNGVERYLTTGWRLSGKELISIKATSTDKSVESEKGWFGSVAVTMVNTTTGVNSFHWGTMEKKTGKVVVDSMAFVMNPRAKNGGYSGTYLNKDK